LIRTIFLAIFLWCSSAFAWGPTGHRVVARIAEKHLSPKAAGAVAELLGPDTLPEVSTWADEIRSDPDWQRASPWHYINIEDGQSFETMARPPGGDIISQLEQVDAVLRNSKSPREQKIVALKFLVHLVADLHQPLHVGRASDRGGNEIRVTWHGVPANLHQVWDSLIIDAENLSFTEWVEFIDPPAAQQVDEWRRSGYLDWMRESLELRRRAYDVGNSQLGYAYSYRNLKVVERRLSQAGVRLAGALNSIFR